MATYFNSANDSLSVEIGAIILSKVELELLIEKIENISSDVLIDQKIRLNYQNGKFKSKLIAQTATQNDTVCGFDKIATKKILSSNKTEFVVNITNTTTNACVDGAVNNIILSHEMKYQLSKFPEWVLNISAIKKMDNPQEFTTRLHEYKNRLLKQYTSFAQEVDETAYDVINLSLQYQGSSISKDEVVSVIDMVSSIVLPNNNAKHYQDTLFAIAKQIYRDPIIANRFKERSGFKKLLPSAVEMSRSIYFKQVLPVIDTFYITDKIDGMRTVLQITEYSKRTGKSKTILGADIFYISSDLTVIQKFDKPSSLRGIDTSITILDAEMIIENEKPTFHVFDVIVINGHKVSNLPFRLRFKEFENADALLTYYKLGHTKKFVKLSKTGYKQELEKFYEEAQFKNYEIDGIIFTPAGVHFKEVLRQKVKLNTEYYNTISFKWKPLEQSTIDFYVMKVDSPKELLKRSGNIMNTSDTVYALCSGVNITTFKKLNLEFFPEYVAPQSENSYQYFPIQFSPYDNPYMYVWTSKETDLGGRVAEFKFIDSHGKFLKKPEIVRMRDDRNVDVRKGEYFGNAIQYAELIWHSIKHPLTFEMLGSKISEIGGYFQSESDDGYFPQRAFNSFVKNELIDTYFKPLIKQGNASLVDLMCGKGQDVARAIDAGFTEITMIDRDIDAIYELLQRKYNLRIKTKDATAKIHIRQVDFEESFDKIIKTVDLPQGVSAGMINFGIHYLAHDHSESHSELPLNEFFKLVNHMLQSKGRFMITCFDGKKIFDLLQDTNEWTSKNKKYSIKRAYTSKEFTDLNQPIDVLLPFSGGTYYREYLVNFNFLERIMNQHGFKVIANESFSTMFQQFKRNNPKVYTQLDDADKEYTSLYSFVIVEKQ